MSLDRKIAERMANLARLDLESGQEGLSQKQKEERLNRLLDEFSQIVGYMDILSQAATDGVEPLYNPLREPQGPRPDEPRLIRNENRSEEILAAAPDRQGRFFAVPKIL
jgi:aspartyl/glutamyl-tRNA(Asn/Gln) amidotransferase C subunit